MKKKFFDVDEKNLKELKKEFNEVLSELGYDKKKSSNKKKVKKSAADIEREQIEIKKQKDEETKYLIIALDCCLFMLCVIGSINLFIYDMIFLGILVLLLIPLIIVVSVLIFFKMTKTTFKERWEVFSKKIDKLLDDEKFLLGCFGVFFIILAIALTIVAIISSNQP